MSKNDVAATKQDIEDLKNLIVGQGTDLHTEIKSQGEELRAEIKSQGDELRAEIKSQGDELRAEMKEIVAESAQEILGAVGTEIQKIHTELEDIRATTTRIENKLDATANKVDDHEVRITTLEHHAA